MPKIDIYRILWMEYRLIRHFGQLEEHANAVGTDFNPCASGRRKGAGAGRCGAWRIGIDVQYTGKRALSAHIAVFSHGYAD
jgi:hypothetical protein